MPTCSPDGRDLMPGLLALVFVIFSFGSATAQATEALTADEAAYARKQIPIPLYRLQGEIVLDGIVDEAEWDRITPLEMTTYSPVYGAPPTERTEVRLAYDDEYVYVSGRMYDSNPSEIRTNTLYRDTYSGDDILAVIFDSYNDYETGVWFVTNPAGARNDMAIFGDAEVRGGQPMNPDWNAHWDVKTSQNEEGWFAEMRIPLSSLGFQVIDDKVTMGLISYRQISRKNERHLFPAIDPEWGGFGFAKPSQSQRISLEGVEESKPVYITPYTLGGFSQNPVLVPSEGTPGTWDTDRDPMGEVGIDLKFSPSSNLTLDVTFNTDFAQVEADQQQINLTRFALFFPEKRQFFQERASTFNFQTGGFLNRLFHSRQIGFGDGEVVRIYGGGRAVGRIGGTDFGFLTMQAASHNSVSTENMGVLRVSQQVFNPFSSIGGMITTRLGDNGTDNVGYGLDAVFRIFGDEYTSFTWAQTFDEDVVEEDALSSGLFLGRWERRKDGGFSYGATYARAGDDYLPRLGFQLRRDYTFGHARFQYKSFRGEESPFRSISFGTRTQHYFRNSDKSPESREVIPALQMEFRGGTQLSLTGTSTFESILTPFSISSVEIPTGEFWFHSVEAKAVRPRTEKFQGDVSVTAGSFYDGSRFSLAFNPGWAVSKNVELGAGYELNRLSFESRGEKTTAHLGRLKIQLALDTKISLSTFAQYSSVADLGSFNTRFRYHFREGTDLWVVYSEGLYATRPHNGLDPRRPRLAGRTLMIKYSHALIF